MKVILIVSALIGVAVGIPAKLDIHQHARSGGYNYQPPKQPSGLYELPAPPKPSGLYELPAPPKPSGLYELPAPPKPSGLYELPSPTTTTTTTTTTRPPPPPPPPQGYLPPEAPSNIVRLTKSRPKPQPKKAMLMPYAFQYGVDDSDSGNYFRHSETSDGEYVTGEYSVLLPDGRIQIVKFTSNPFDGYVAEVTYQ